jgi:hypothetical protein
MKTDMKSKILIFIILVVFTFSCGRQNKNQGDIRTILLKKTDDVQPISGFVSEIEYVELEFPEVDRVIGKITGLKLLDDEFLIKHRFSNVTNLLHFSGDGSFLNEIGKNGGNAGNDFYPRDIIAYKNGYAVWDSTGISSFSKSGEWEEKLFDVRYHGNRFFHSSNKFYFFHETNAPGLLSEYSETGKQERIFQPYNQGFEGQSYAGVTELAKDSFHLFTPINDTVYAFANNNLSPKYIISGRSYPTLIQLLKKAGLREKMEMLRFINSNRHWVITQFLENRNFIFVAYKQGSYSFSLIIRKNNWETVYVKNLINDIDGGVWSDPVYLSDDDVLYVPLSSYQITGHTIKNRKKHSFEDLQKETEANKNPVIMMCKLK